MINRLEENMMSTSLAEENKVGTEDMCENIADNQQPKSTTTGKKFVCEICNASFTMIGNLNRHKKGHSNHRPYTCKFCLRGFLRRTSYNEHIRLHTGEKPYQCETCLQTFVRKKCHQMHIRKCKESSFSKLRNPTSHENLMNSSRGLTFLPAASMTRPVLAEDQPLDLSVRQFQFDNTNETQVEQVQIKKFMKTGLQFHVPFMTEYEKCLDMSPIDNSPTLLSMENETQSYSLLHQSEYRLTPAHSIEPVALHQLHDSGINQLWPCRYCQVYFTDSVQLREHMLCHDTVNPLTCSVCGKMCKSSNEFLKHH
ncbi:hypothetical protein EB796_017641 [Bugula neritina]|uniref:C2H2-type domain-containing protein n=1 Tax=Bugula neritina TaxID=10212 RepID=A0A7J7JD54_BUGNE|nr:hypothetical protein EB796_017641 [Bugula neritina]